MSTTQTTAGQLLAAKRPMIKKICPECGNPFTGLKRKVLCEPCRIKVKQRAYDEKKRQNKKGA
jgi:uncharacterized Zn finger protein (UPF0148 family)